LDAKHLFFALFCGISCLPLLSKVGEAVLVVAGAGSPLSLSANRFYQFDPSLVRE
jgi:hypothetical protein